MAFCTNCGRQVPDGTKFCTGCGTKLGGAPNPNPNPNPNYNAAPNPGYNAAPNPGYNAAPNPGYNANPNPDPGYAPNYNANGAPAMKRLSDWDGGVFETFVASFATSLIISFTCGIATPWAVCYMWRFIISHAVVDGKRLVFDGTGGQLFGNWIKWFLLTLITCGIYSFWVAPRLYRWIASHTHFAHKN